MPDAHFPETKAIGGSWNRQNNPEVELVGSDTAPTASAVHLVGSVKWRDDKPFDSRDLNELDSHAQSVPGAEHAELVAVTRTAPPQRLDGLTACWDPEDIIGAWET